MSDARRVAKPRVRTRPTPIIHKTMGRSRGKVVVKDISTYCLYTFATDEEEEEEYRKKRKGVDEIAERLRTKEYKALFKRVKRWEKGGSDLDGKMKEAVALRAGLKEARKELVEMSGRVRQRAFVKNKGLREEVVQVELSDMRRGVEEAESERVRALGVAVGATQTASMAVGRLRKKEESLIEVLKDKAEVEAKLRRLEEALAAAYWTGAAYWASQQGGVGGHSGQPGIHPADRAARGVQAAARTTRAKRQADKQPVEEVQDWTGRKVKIFKVAQK